MHLHPVDEGFISCQAVGALDGQDRPADGHKAHRSPETGGQETGRVYGRDSRKGAPGKEDPEGKICRRRYLLQCSHGQQADGKVLPS